MENNVAEKSKGNNLVVIVLVILLLAACGFICYDKLLKKDDSISKDCDCPTCNNNSSGSDTMKNENGKIVIKRNGVAKLENVPSDVVGKYQNDAGDYYKLNQDGTAEIYASTGCSDCESDTGLISSSELSYQLDYVGSGDDETVIVEFYLNSENHKYVPGKAIYGFKWQGAYRFNVIENTPTSTVGETIFDKK